MRTVSLLIWPGIAAIVFQIGITLSSTANGQEVALRTNNEKRHAPWFTRRILVWLSWPVKLRASSCEISAKSRCAFAHEIGRLGILGMFSPSVRVAFSYAGYPGVVGSPISTMLGMCVVRFKNKLTRIQREELDRATLHRCGVTGWPSRVRLIPILHCYAAVIAGVRIDQDSYSP